MLILWIKILFQVEKKNRSFETPCLSRRSDIFQWQRVSIIKYLQKSRLDYLTICILQYIILIHIKKEYNEVSCYKYMQYKPQGTGHIHEIVICELCNCQTVDLTTLWQILVRWIWLQWSIRSNFEGMIMINIHHGS